MSLPRFTLVSQRRHTNARGLPKKENEVPNPSIPPCPPCETDSFSGAKFGRLQLSDFLPVKLR
jgi:hypothetical protein